VDSVIAHQCGIWRLPGHIRTGSLTQGLMIPVQPWNLLWGGLILPSRYAGNATWRLEEATEAQEKDSGNVPVLRPRNPIRVTGMTHVLISFRILISYRSTMDPAALHRRTVPFCDLHVTGPLSVISWWSCKPTRRRWMGVTYPLAKGA